MAKNESRPPSPTRFVVSVSILCLLSICLLLARIIATDSSRYLFLLWNLVLAAVPVFIAIWLVQRVKKHGWLRWEQIGLSVLLLGFLPNSFYLITDFVHLRNTFEISLIYDIVLLASFMCSGLILGYTSVYVVHQELKRRLSEKRSFAIIGGVFLLVSFAIYLGRYTRWNTWDLLLQPAGLLFDVSDRFVNPAVHADTYVTSITIFLLLLSVYTVIYEALRLIRHP